MQSIQLQSLLAHKIKNSQKAKNLKLFELCILVERVSDLTLKQK